ncbi:GmrSD restriction endonuclease domain-containing protein [Agromyces mariniharenae]|uniref:DUF262 domain-containing protein n=1 Tax=Agromyces mariniharenae TaxID=2604423 RepID=A0A5S4VIS4_9MICO|nr:DUF262 domain-containing protein [Agromyces mariniharenae]TYL54025.1 DUF262 domain-containing protein [Agromyces mariniharenae]
MKTDVTTPQGIFGMPQHLTVPLYQRPYVWNEDEQWGPLWADIRRIAEHRLGGTGTLATHFLGAVVTQQADTQPVGVQEFLIVDGQQRLTTLQLVLDATAAAFRARELDALTGQLEFLTHNSAMFLGSDQPGLKLRHTNRDRGAFREVMQAIPPIEYAALSHRDSLLVKAHEFFYGRVGKWLDEGPEAPPIRADALSVALQNALELVVIQLSASEDSQEIFETLNARGTPLTAADLIKNFVFQRLKQEGEDEERAYRELWPFETKFWEAEVSVGRFATTRSAVFLSQWLVSRVGKEISPRSTFTRFKFFVEHETTLSMVELLRLISEQARTYQQLTERAADAHADLSRLELHMYRMGIAQVEITKPIVLWLTEPGAGYSKAVMDRVIDMVESWIVRRRLLRLQSSDLGRIAADLVSTGRGVAESELIGVVERFLTGQQYASTYWPGDAEITSALATEHFYRRFSQPMQRLLLQAAEDWYRGYGSRGASKTGVRVFRDKQQVEHILPRGWRTNWPVTSAADEADRDDHVHRLGNLTLLTGSLNASVSNSGWLGDKGKRSAVDRHDVFLMNRAVVARSVAGWDESMIDERTAELTRALLETWPVPDTHEGKVIDRSSRLSKATVSYAHLIAAGLLQVGATLVCTDERWPDARCEVLAGGQVLYGGKRYSSPAAAARQVREGKSGNAWYFWRVENGAWLNTLRDRLLNGDGAGGGGLSA